MLICYRPIQKAIGHSKFVQPLNSFGGDRGVIERGISADEDGNLVGLVSRKEFVSNLFGQRRVGLKRPLGCDDRTYGGSGNFRLLFDLRAISIGIIVTRGDKLQAIFNSLGIGAKYGASTTHMSKLLPRIEGGGGGGCPVLVIGITPALYVENH